MYKMAIFDLDGTLADSKYGIMESAAKALDAMGIGYEEKDLMLFVGPPLWDIFGRVYGMDRAEQEKGVAAYRNHYNERGIFNVRLFDGVGEMLTELRDRGVILGVATAKPQVMAEKVLDYLGIAQYFDGVAGANLDGTRSDKEELIGYFLDKFPEIDRKDVCMSGDGENDGMGANRAGVDFYAVLNDREREDFEGINVMGFAETVGELHSFLTCHKVKEGESYDIG